MRPPELPTADDLASALRIWGCDDLAEDFETVAARRERTMEHYEGMLDELLAEMTA